MKKIIQQLTKLYPTKYIVLTKEYRRHINTELIYSVYCRYYFKFWS